MTQFLTGDCREVLRTLPDECVQCVITSPPYFGLRDYGGNAQIGIEDTLDEYVANLAGVFAEVRRVLKPDGTLWLNLGDSYAGSWGAQSHRETVATISRNSIRNHPKRASHTGKIRQSGLKPKDLCGVPWRVAFALQADGWYLRSDIIWEKPNPMPESVRDRPTRAHEYLFLLTRSERYHYDQDAVREEMTTASDPRNRPDYVPKRGQYDTGRPDGMTGPSGASTWPVGGRNRRTVWTVTPQPFKGAHFATFPEALVEPCILAGCPAGGTVLDPFAGSGTVGVVASRLGRRCILIEQNPAYVAMAQARCLATQPGLGI